jgi:hypothetical protein
VANLWLRLRLQPGTMYKEGKHVVPVVPLHAQSSAFTVYALCGT